MQLAVAVLRWLKANGLFVTVGAILGLALYVAVITYSVVGEVLSIAQRGYFFSVPAEKLLSRDSKTLEVLRQRLERKLERDFIPVPETTRGVTRFPFDKETANGNHR
jgi:hypothetical protein